MFPVIFYLYFVFILSVFDCLEKHYTKTTAIGSSTNGSSRCLTSAMSPKLTLWMRMCACHCSAIAIPVAFSQVTAEQPPQTLALSHRELQIHGASHVVQRSHGTLTPHGPTEEQLVGSGHPARTQRFTSMSHTGTASQQLFARIKAET